MTKKFDYFFSTFLEEMTSDIDSAYQSLVATGETDKLYAMVDAAAKSKGYTLGPVFHGTANDFHSGKKGASEFKKGTKGFRPGGGNGPFDKLGFFFTRNQEYAKVYSLMSYQGSTLKEPLAPFKAYLKGNFWDLPKQYFSEIMNWGNLPDQKYKTLSQARGAASKLLQSAKEQGYSGIIFQMEADVDEIVVFEPNQIKSAELVIRDKNKSIIPLSQRFNSKTADVRY